MTRDPDLELVKKAQQRDEAAFSALYLKYVQPIYRFFYWQTNQSGDAEDLTSETFLEMAKSIRTFQGKSSFKNWLYAIAKHVLAEWIRKKYALPSISLFDSIPDTDHWIDPENITYKETVIKKLLATLPSQHQKVLTLRYLRGFSVEETAKTLRLTVSNVKVITMRSLAKLAKGSRV